MVRNYERAPAEPTPAEIEWRKRLDELDRSGLSRNEFAASRRLRADALSWWRCEINRRERVRHGAVRPASPEPSAPLLPVSILATPARMQPRILAESTVDVVVRGVAVRVGAGFDAELLRAVVDALAEPC